jgi:proline-specific peptidase
MADEGYVEVPGGKVWWQSVGGGDGTPLLCLHGGPGFTHHYLERLADLGDRRRVVFYDQLGCGNSDRPDDTSLWTVERFVEELAVVREALGLDDLHLFGSSWGGMLAMQYTLDRRPPLRSLVLCGSPASIPRWIRECAALLEAEPEEMRATIREHEASGFTACPEYQAAILGFYRKHVCRLDPWPPGLERSFATAGYQVYETMNGPSEFTVVGTIKDWDVTERLGEIGVPTLLVGGRYDECRPEHLQDMQRRIRNCELAIIEDASHLCFAEQPADFARVVNDFLDRVERGRAAIEPD